jgi:hypothetical protein
MSEEFSEKFKKLPQQIQEIMLSPQTADINWDIAQKYKLSDEKTEEMVSIIVGVILKEISPESFSTTLQQKLLLDAQTARQMVTDIAIKRFLPIKNYLPSVEMLTRNLGGKIPEMPPSQPHPDSSNVVDLRNQ